MSKKMVLVMALAVGLLTAAGSPPAAPPQVPTDKEVIDNPIAKPAPKYPNAAVDGLVEGVVTLEVVIGIDGMVKYARVVKAEPPGWFEDAALAAVRQWKYRPVDREITFTTEIAFELPEDFKAKMRALDKLPAPN